MDDTKNPVAPAKDPSGDEENQALLDVYNHQIVEIEHQQTQGRPDQPLDPKDIHVMAYGLICDLARAVTGWKLKREMGFENKIYRTYTEAITDQDGDNKLIFTEIQLIFATPDAHVPMEGNVTETRPDDNGSLHERHFSLKIGADETTSEITYAEYPYRQVEFAKPTTNTKGIVVLARRMIHGLPRLD